MHLLALDFESNTMENDILISSVYNKQTGDISPYSSADS